MTVIVASLFLPHTVTFNIETGSEPETPRATEASEFDESPIATPIAITELSERLKRQTESLPDLTSIPDIISSLAKSRLSGTLTSTQNSPVVGSPNNDGFFFHPRGAPSSLSRGSTSPGSSPPRISSFAAAAAAAAAAASSGAGAKFAFQPQSRKESPAPSSSIVDSKKRSNLAPLLSKPGVPASSTTGTVVSVDGRPLPQKVIRRLSSETRLLNEATWNIEPQFSGNGGLRNAIRRSQEEGRIGEVMWIGTLGMSTDALTDDTKSAIEDELSSEYNNLPVYVSDVTYDGHYNHYCKEILWPTLHYQVPDDPKSKAFEDHSWGHYKRLNQAVADRIVQVYKPGDVIWINDYHLLLVSNMVRKKLPHAKIGFFLHVAFPSSEVFRCLAWRKELLEGMLGANCIGFQIPEYSRHFLQTCNRILSVDTTPSGIRDEGKFVSVVSVAIGIDPTSLKSELASEEVQQWRQMIRERWPYDKKLIVARDKLDHIRGVKQKLQAYEEFLRTHPEWIDRCVLIQVCLTNVADAELEREVSTTVDRINSMRSNLAASQPIVFLKQDIDFEQYIALLAEANAFAVTSLREGMNLTCHEFIYCNDPSLHSPLILSEFTGSASVLGNEAILVNPWDKREMAEAFYTAVTMEQEERDERHAELYQYVTSHTCSEWVEIFHRYVDSAWETDRQRKINSLHRLELSKLRSQYHRLPRLVNAAAHGAHEARAGHVSAAPTTKKAKRLFLLNLDSTGNEGPTSASGSTLSSTLPRSSSTASLSSTIVAGPFRQATPPTYISPQRQISVLSELVSDPENIVYMISSDSRYSMERKFRQVGNIGLIAENGAFLRLHGSTSWQSFVDPGVTREWHDAVKPMISDIAERLPGSWVQVNDSSVHLNVSHVFSEQDPERASIVIGECINHINDAFAAYHVRARLIDEEKVVIEDSSQTLLLRAAEAAYAQANSDTSAVGFLLVALGQSELEDCLFEWANKLGSAYTVSLGFQGTLARWAVEGVNALLNALLTASRTRI
ncbi:trehalose synthase complex regulatory subunit Tps3p [Trichomonascus vanleenenianus]|uniref:trehalose 6-phosphate synthase/phosphatase complex subunit n=1 Tax=Trichomonascus vanleenenianus TaxID=2268995 RepID=UPI003EC9A488